MLAKSPAGFKVQEKGKAPRERDAIAVECCVRQYYIAEVSQKQGIRLIPPDTCQALCLYYAEPLSPILAQRVQRARLTELTRVVITTTVHRSRTSCM
jgi:hypothetical protein